MAIEARCRRHSCVARSPGFSLTFLSAGALLLAGQTAHAQVAAPTANGGAPRDPWRFQPALTIEETYSDNINLMSKGSERSDLVTTISPSLTITRLGPWLTLNFNYAPQLLYYARGTNGSTIRNNLNAAASATLVQNLLFFDAQATIAQQNVSPFGTQAAGTINGSSNSTETRSYSLGPTLRSRFGNDLSYTAGYSFQDTSSGTTAYGTNTTSTLYGQFGTGTSTRNLAYNANFSRSDQDFGSSGEIITETVSNGLTYLVSPTIRVHGNVGYDHNRYPTSGAPDLKGASYSAGGDWNPSQHTSFSGLLGHRYFGPTANVSFRESGTRFSFSLSYTRDQRTSSGSGLTLVANPNYVLLDSVYAASFPDPIQRQLVVQQVLAQSGLSTSPYGVSSFVSNQLFLEKALQGSVAFLGLYNTVTLNAIRTESQSLSNIQTVIDAFDQAQKFSVTSYSANWAHKLGPRTNLNASFTKTRNVAIIGVGETSTRTAQVSLTRQLSRRVNAAVSVRNTVQNGTGGNAAGNFYNGNYRENQLLGSLRLTF